jgi:hypothetical protein
MTPSQAANLGLWWKLRKGTQCRHAKLERMEAQPNDERQVRVVCSTCGEAFSSQTASKGVAGK